MPDDEENASDDERLSDVSEPEFHAPSEDVALFERIKAGEEEAWHELYRKYSGRLYAQLRRFGVRQENIPDCVQDILFGLFRTQTKFDPSRGG